MEPYVLRTQAKNPVHPTILKILIQTFSRRAVVGANLRVRPKSGVFGL